MPILFWIVLLSAAQNRSIVFCGRTNAFFVLLLYDRFLLNGPQSLSIVGVINDGLMNRVHSLSICFFDQ